MSAIRSSSMLSLRESPEFRPRRGGCVVSEFAAQSVFRVLAVLAHHDDRRLNGGEHGEEKIQQNEWVGLPGVLAHKQAERGVSKKDYQEGDDKRPGASKSCDRLGH